MADTELGRFACTKCGGTVVAVGVVARTFPGIGAFCGPCPFNCGAWINRGFRHVKPGNVRAHRAEDWAEAALSRTS